MRELTMEESRLVGGGDDIEIQCCSGKLFGLFEVNVNAFTISFDLPEATISDPMDRKLQIGPEYQLTGENEEK